MDVVFLPKARQELEEATSYYDSQRRELGDRFLDEIQAAMDRIADDPESWEVVEGDDDSVTNVRRCRVRRFPYALLYQVRNDVALVVATMHLHRKQDYWRDRI